MKTPRKERVIRIALLAASLVFSLLLAEAGYRVCVFLIRGDPRPVVTLDEQVGWKPTGNLRLHKTLRDDAGSKYTLDYSTSVDGFRMYGDVNSERRRVFFLGDSFTWAQEVSDSKTYFAILAAKLPLEVFAFGGGGYGTLQEFMILDKFADSIRPDLLILQFCENDFVNNSLEMDRATRRNNPLRRPYLTGSETVEYAFPCRFELLRDFIYRYSRLLSWLTGKLDKMMYQYGPSRGIEDEIAELSMKHPVFSRAVHITDRLFRKIKQRIPHTPIMAFCVDDREPHHEQFKRLSRQNGIEVIEGVARAVQDAEKRGVVVRAEDGGHWNEAGHEICAEVLRAHLVKTWIAGSSRKAR